jgi:uncharacterized protein (DUF58 family)
MAWLDLARSTIGAESFDAGAIFFLAAGLLYLFLLVLTTVWAFDTRDLKKSGEKHRITDYVGWRLVCLAARGCAGLVLVAIGTAMYVVLRKAVGHGAHFGFGFLLGLLLAFYTLAPTHLTFTRFNQARRVLAAIRHPQQTILDDVEVELDKLTNPTVPKKDPS